MLLFGSAVLVVLLSTWSFAQFQQPKEPVTPENMPILSGADVGFRLESFNREGQPVGTMMVRVRGEWGEARFAPGRRLIQ
jgi:hypothetical protein